MQIKYLGLLTVLSLVSAKDDDDVEFLTDLVNDYKDNTSDYIEFIKTASTIPAALTSLALQVATYTDDSYTTLLANSDINVDSLKAFATQLPWYSSRLEDGDDSDDESSETRSADAASKGSSASSSKTASSSSSSSSAGGVGQVVAPAGALLGMVALALM